MGVISAAFKLTAYSAILVFLFTFLPGIPPHLKFDTYSLPEAMPLVGKLAPNGILDKAEILVGGKFWAPETVAISPKDGKLYTGVTGGYILKIDGETGVVSKVVNLGPAKRGRRPWEEEARPMGLRFSRDGKLFVADAYFGLFEVDVADGKAVNLISRASNLPDNIPINYLNDLDIDNDEGRIYFTDSSILSQFHNIYIESLGDPSGRLLSYDMKTRKTEVLMSGVHYANGVQLSKGADFVLVVESVRGRIWKYHLKGSQKDKKEIFVDGLPGVPDNLRSNGNDGFYVCLIAQDTEQEPSPFRVLGSYPFVRKLVLRGQHITLQLLDAIYGVLPHELVESAYRWASHLGSVGDMTTLPRKVIIVELDGKGSVLGSLQNSDKKMGFISDIELGEKYAYFGTPFDDKVWRIKRELLRLK